MALFILTKKCSKCASELPLSDFHIQKEYNGRKTRYASACKVCSYARQLQYRAGRRQDLAKQSRDYYASNREKALDQAKAYRKLNWEKLYTARKIKQNENREEYLETKRISYEKNKHKYRDRMRAYSRSHPNPTTTARRRAALKKAIGNFTKKQWLDKLAYWGNKCYLCRESSDKLEADHRIPVAKGGSNWISNIAPACLKCNRAKGVKTEKEFRLTQL